MVLIGQELSRHRSSRFACEMVNDHVMGVTSWVPWSAGELNGEMDSVPLTRIKYSRQEMLGSVAPPCNFSGPFYPYFEQFGQ